MLVLDGSIGANRYQTVRVILIDAQERLQRVLAARGAGSRRGAEALIVAGRVTVDGKAVTLLGTKVDPRTAEIRLDGKLLRPRPFRYVLLNKPSGYITTTSDERGRRTVMELVDGRERLYPVGRLDRDTEGLLLLTNDGEVANRVMHPRYEMAKEYHILTLTRPSAQTIQRVRDGIEIDGRRVVPDEFRLLRETRDGILLTMVLHEGLFHVVRRMMEAVRIDISELRRVRLGPLSLIGIPVGASRDLTPGERSTLLEAIRIDPSSRSGRSDSPSPTRVRPAAPRTSPSSQAQSPSRHGPVPRTAGSRPTPVAAGSDRDRTVGGGKSHASTRNSPPGRNRHPKHSPAGSRPDDPAPPPSRVRAVDTGQADSDRRRPKGQRAAKHPEERRQRPVQGGTQADGARRRTAPTANRGNRRDVNPHASNGRASPSGAKPASKDRLSKSTAFPANRTRPTTKRQRQQRHRHRNDAPPQSGRTGDKGERGGSESE